MPKKQKLIPESDPALEVFEERGKLNELKIIQTQRKNGTKRIQISYENCPTMTEQHTAHLSDLNYLIATYKPDELAAYIAAKNSHRTEIIGHDFSQEPDLQGAKNITYELRMAFEKLDPEVKMHFKNHVEFLKFIDNPANQEKMLKLGLMTKREIQQNTTNAPTYDAPEGGQEAPVVK